MGGGFSGQLISGSRQWPGRTFPMLGEGSTGAAEESRTTHLLVQPRKELFCRPCKRMNPLGQPLETVLGGSPAPDLCSNPPPSAPSCSPSQRGPRTEEVSLASLARGKEPRGCKTTLRFLDRRAKQNKTQNKKLSQITVLPRGKSLLKSSQPAWPLSPAEPQKRLAQVGGLMGAGAGGA